MTAAMTWVSLASAMPANLAGPATETIAPMTRAGQPMSGMTCRKPLLPMSCRRLAVMQTLQ